MAQFSHRYPALCETSTPWHILHIGQFCSARRGRVGRGPLPSVAGAAPAVEVRSYQPNVAGATAGMPTHEDVMSMARDEGRGAAAMLAAAGVVVAVLAGVALVGNWRGWLPELGNPFESQVTDRSQPALLRSVRNLSRFVAASGDFQVVIDVERNRRFIPDVLVGERTLFVAAGTVEAYVEFAGLAEDAIEVGPDGEAVTVTLPEPQLAPPNLDHDRSYLFAQERGVANRISDFFRTNPEQQQQVLRLAEQRIAEAAQDSELRARAAENTQRMLEGMLTSLGFEQVTVTFVAT